MGTNASVGRTYGWLKVTHITYSQESNKTHYTCVCSCNKQFKIRSDYVQKFVEGKTRSDICLTCFHKYKALPNDNFKWIEGTTYAVNTDGLVWSAKRELLLTASQDSNGYSVINLGKYSGVLKVHRLVAEAFIDNPDNKSCVNHINGIKSDNRVSNLEWATHAENTAHAHSSGLCSGLYGESNHNSKLSSKDVKSILNSSEDVGSLSTEYAVCRSTINRIKRGVSRKNG